MVDSLSHRAEVGQTGIVGIVGIVSEKAVVNQDGVVTCICVAGKKKGEAVDQSRMGDCVSLGAGGACANEHCTGVVHL